MSLVTSKKSKVQSKKRVNFPSGYGYTWGYDCDTEHSEFTPQEHQEFVLNYFLNDLKHKGLILYHRLGSGKTCTSIITSDAMLEEGKVRNIFVLTPGVLRQGWIDEYCDVCGKDSETLKKRYIFISYNFSGLMNNPNFHRYSFNNSIVIIDEVHKLINGVKNNTISRVSIYEKIMKSDCKVLALTGTPIYSRIEEFPILAKLVNPDSEFGDIMDYRKNKYPNNLTAANEMFEANFKSLFTFKENGKIKSIKVPRRFMLDVCGIISYYPGKKGDDYPEIQYMDPIKVVMSKEQEEYYFIQKEEEEKYAKPPAESMKKEEPKKYKILHSLNMMYYKRIMSRSASNFYYPPRYRNSYESLIYYVDKLVGEDDEEEERKLLLEMAEDKDKDDDEEKEPIVESRMEKSSDDVEEIEEKEKKKKKLIPWVKPEYFDNRRLATIYSRKFAAMFLNIIKHPNDKHMVFTSFVTKGGIEMINTLFKMCGVRPYLFYGSIENKRRTWMLKKYNRKLGPVKKVSDIRVILVSEAGAEGITLKGTNHVHIMESAPKETLTEQAIGRAARYKSHSNVPPEKRWVKIWRYWSTASPEPINIDVEYYKKGEGKGKKTKKVKQRVEITNKVCIDEILYNRGVKEMNTIKTFLQILQYYSIEETMKRDGKLPC